MKTYRSTIILSVILLGLSVWSLFCGVLDIQASQLLTGDMEQWEIFLISRLPRLLAFLCTGVGMSVAGLIMQQLCRNKFVSPTTGVTISSAQFGILLALLFLPNSTLWSRALFAFVMAIAGTWAFVWFIQRIQFKDVVMVPLVASFSNINSEIILLSLILLVVLLFVFRRELALLDVITLGSFGYGGAGCHVTGYGTVDRCITGVSCVLPTSA